MMQLAYNVIDIIAEVEFKKNNPPRHPHLDRFKVDASLIDPNLTECWVVFGTGLPEINGTYQYQKDFSKASANDFCRLINNLWADGYRSAQVGIRNALGIKD